VLPPRCIAIVIIIIRNWHHWEKYPGIKVGCVYRSFTQFIAYARALEWSKTASRNSIALGACAWGIIADVTSSLQSSRLIRLNAELCPTCYLLFADHHHHVASWFIHCWIKPPLDVSTCFCSEQLPSNYDFFQVIGPSCPRLLLSVLGLHSKIFWFIYHHSFLQYVPPISTFATHSMTFSTFVFLRISSFRT